MTTDFYMTLPSNASMKTHPDNTLTHYVTELPHRVELVGEWECGLTEMQYSHTWYNVTENDVWLFLEEADVTDVTRRTRLSCGYYDDPLTLMHHVNNGLYTLRTEKTRAQMSYSSVTQNDVTHDGEHQVHHTVPQLDYFHVRIPQESDHRNGNDCYVRVVIRLRLSNFRLLVPLPHRSPRRGGHDAGVQHPIRIHGRRGVSYSG